MCMIEIPVCLSVWNNSARNILSLFKGDHAKSRIQRSCLVTLTCASTPGHIDLETKLEYGFILLFLFYYICCCSHTRPLFCSMHWELSQQCSWSCRIRFAACFSFSGSTSVTSFFFNCFSYFRVNWFRCCWIKDQTRLGDDLSQKHFMALEGESLFCFHLPDWWLTVDIVSSSLVDDSGSRKKEKRNRYLFFFCSMSVWRAKKWCP